MSSTLSSLLRSLDSFCFQSPSQALSHFTFRRRQLCLFFDVFFHLWSNRWWFSTFELLLFRQRLLRFLGFLGLQEQEWYPVLKHQTVLHHYLGQRKTSLQNGRGTTRNQEVLFEFVLSNHSVCEHFSSSLYSIAPFEWKTSSLLMPCEMKMNVRRRISCSMRFAVDLDSPTNHQIDRASQQRLVSVES